MSAHRAFVLKHAHHSSPIGVNRELGLDEGDFHLRRSRTAPQFKDETATLKYVHHALCSCGKFAQV